MCDADVVGRGDYLVALAEARVGGRYDDSGTVDPAHAGKTPDDLAGPRRGQGILVVDAGESGPDGHLSRIQRVEVHLHQAGDDLAFLVEDPERFELRHR